MALAMLSSNVGSIGKCEHWINALMTRLVLRLVVCVPYRFRPARWQARMRLGECLSLVNMVTLCWYVRVLGRLILSNRARLSRMTKGLLAIVYFDRW